jgi:RES domain-containing protein
MTAPFKSWNSYSDFSREVARQRRYVRTREAEDFLRAVAATCTDRLRAVPKGRIFWRAQLGHDLGIVDQQQGYEQDVAFPPSRMKPRPERAPEGRANPKGIPCLYLSTTPHAAMSEVRPWVGALVSVGQFQIVRDLTIVDCSVLHDQYFSLAYRSRVFDVSGGLSLPLETDFEKIVWAAIDGAFSQPVTPSDDVAKYAATQIIAELFRDEGYHGVAYKSAFGEDGYNVALFNWEDAQQVNGMLHRVETAEFKFGEPPEDEYFIRDGTVFRTVVTVIGPAPKEDRPEKAADGGATLQC